MFSRHSKHITAQVFLFVFIFIKASGLHAFVHKHHNLAEVEHCVLCHIFSRDNLTPVLPTDNSVDFEIAEFQVYPEFINHYTYLASAKMDIGEIYNKPPPFYTLPNTF